MRIRRFSNLIATGLCLLVGSGFPGCYQESGGEPPPTLLAAEHLSLGEVEHDCGPATYPALVASYPVSNIAPTDVPDPAYYVAAVGLTVEGASAPDVFEIGFREGGSDIARLGPGESDRVEIRALRQPLPGEAIEIRVSYLAVPAPAASGSALYSLDRGFDRIAFEWACPVSSGPGP